MKFLTMKNNINKINGGILPAVLVFSSVMLLIVIGVISLRGNLAMLIYRNHYYNVQKSYLKSGFLLYDKVRSINSETAEDMKIRLFEEIDDSEIFINKKLWGLYEITNISNYNKTMIEYRMTGLGCENENYTLFYRENGSPLFLTGTTTIEGKVNLPKAGFKYAQLQSDFFSGKELMIGNIGISGENLPDIDFGVKKYLDSLLRLKISKGINTYCPDSLIYPFSNPYPYIISTGGKKKLSSLLKGYIMLISKEIIIDSCARLEDIIILADKIKVKSGFVGTAQLLANDSIIIEERVNLKFPSGVFLYPKNKNRYALLSKESCLEGYVVIDGEDNEDIIKPNFCQQNDSYVNGLLYVNGVGVFSGNLTGRAVLGKAVYYTNDGYYDNIISDMMIKESNSLTLPIWFKMQDNYCKKEIKWLK